VNGEKLAKYLFENDYSTDSLRWIRKLEERHISPYGNHNTIGTEDLETFQNEIIYDNDSALAYFFAYDFPYKPYRMQKIILDNKDPKYAYLFAQNIPNCDVRALQKVVIDSMNLKYICKFACFVIGADLNELEKIVLKSKNVKYAHMYLKYITGADVNKFKKIILSLKKPRYLYALSKHLTDPKEIAKIEKLIIESGSQIYMRLFAAHVKSANVDRIEQAVLASGNEAEIKRFARYVKRSKMKNFLLVD